MLFSCYFPVRLFSFYQVCYLIQTKSLYDFPKSNNIVRCHHLAKLFEEGISEIGSLCRVPPQSSIFSFAGMRKIHISCSTVMCGYLFPFFFANQSSSLYCVMFCVSFNFQRFKADNSGSLSG